MSTASSAKRLVGCAIRSAVLFMSVSMETSCGDTICVGDIGDLV